MASSPVPLGATLSGKYRMERILGEGGMGVVVLAQHLELDQPVAIKFLLEGLADREEGAERFRREARAAAKIHSDHVVRVLDVGVMPDGVRYMVMEYLEGRDLAEELSDRGSFPLGVACGFVLEAMDAVGHAHAVGIVHRDLKPANLFLAKRPDGSQRIKVLDFGISKTIGATTNEQLSLTKTSAWIGSPLYMAPEQMQSARDVDLRADIWSLGAILYEFIAGVPPYQAESLPQLCNLLITTDAPSIQTHKPEVPDDLAHAIMSCLVRDKAKRLSHVTDLAKVVVRYATTITGSGMSRIMLERADGIYSKEAQLSREAQFSREAQASKEARTSQEARSSEGKALQRSTAPSFVPQPQSGTSRSSSDAPVSDASSSARGSGGGGVASASGSKPKSSRLEGSSTLGAAVTLSSDSRPGTSSKSSLPVTAPIGDRSTGGSAIHSAWGATENGGRSRRGVSSGVWLAAGLVVTLLLGGIVWTQMKQGDTKDLATGPGQRDTAETPELVPEPHDPIAPQQSETQPARPAVQPTAASPAAAVASPAAAATADSVAAVQAAVPESKQPVQPAPAKARPSRRPAPAAARPAATAPSSAEPTVGKPAPKPSDEFSDFGGRR